MGLPDGSLRLNQASEGCSPVFLNDSTFQEPPRGKAVTHERPVPLPKAVSLRVRQKQMETQYKPKNVGMTKQLYLLSKCVQSLT